MSKNIICKSCGNSENFELKPMGTNIRSSYRLNCKNPNCNSHDIVEENFLVSNFGMVGRL